MISILIFNCLAICIFHMWLVLWKNCRFGEVWKSGPSGCNDKMLLQSLVTTLVALRLQLWLLETDINIFWGFCYLFTSIPCLLLAHRTFRAGWLDGYLDMYGLDVGGIWGNSLHSLWSARILRSWHGGCGRGSLFGRYFSDQYAVKVGSSDPLPEA